MINSGTLSELEHFGNPKYEKLLKSPIILWGGKEYAVKMCRCQLIIEIHITFLYSRKISWPISICLHKL